MIRLPCFDLTHCPDFGTSFGWETKGIWTHVLHRSCNCICELDVRLLNHPNWTSIAQVMVHFSGLPHLRLFIYLRLDLGLFEDEFLNRVQNYLVAWIWIC